MFFQSHVPNYVDSDPAIPKQEFRNLEELLKHPWIKRWDRGQPEFNYCWDDNDGKWSKAVLMVSYKDKEGRKTWWVLGYLSEIPGNLPKMQYPPTSTLNA